MRSLIGVHCLGGSFLEGTVVLLTQRVAVDSQVTLHSHNGIKAVEEIKNAVEKKNHIRAFSLLNVPG